MNKLTIDKNISEVFKRLIRSVMVITTFVLLFSGVGLICGLDHELETGHLKPFGFGKTVPVDEVYNFPNPKQFFQNYVWPLKPLKMIGAVKGSTAFQKWSDDYFLSLPQLKDNPVSVETMKKESRQQEVLSISFLDFIRTYNNTENYMVDSVPEPLRSEVLMPCPIQCFQVVENNLVDNVMWYSSGGTKSVVHTDSVDNINCLYRGEKELYFVDPAFADMVDLDRPEGAYSSMDVDRWILIDLRGHIQPWMWTGSCVDFTKFPGMAEVEYYYHVNMTAGDCLYIPYKWIHQVRSYGSNLAVNIWWKHHLTEDIDFGRCNDPCDLEFTLAEVDFGGFTQTFSDPEEIRSHFRDFVGKKKKINLPTLLKPLLGSEYRTLLQSSRKNDLLMLTEEIFVLIDKDGDRYLTREEVERAEPSVLQTVGEKLMSLEVIVNNMYDEINIDDIDDDEVIGGDRDETDSDDLHGKDEL